MRAIDIANFFIDMSLDEPEEIMTNLRVNKLVYYAQGWSLARNGRPFFDEEIEAWKFGPVEPTVYHTFKPCGSERIASVFGDYSSDIFATEDLELLLDVMREYGKYTSPALVKMTHKKGTPWEAVYEAGKNNIIKKEQMKKYFESEVLDSFSISPASEDKFVGYRDKDGYLVLPKEMDDAE